MRWLQCVIPFRCLKLQVLFDLFLLSLNRLSYHLSSVCPPVAKYIFTFAGSSTPYTCYTLVCSGSHRRSTQIPDWVFTIFEKLSLPCYRDRPSRILLFLHSLGQFLVSPKIQFVVRDLSVFGTTLFSVLFERVHRAYGLIRLPWRTDKIYIYILWNPGKATTALATNLHGQVPQILFIAQLPLSPPAFYIYRRLGAADLQLNFPLEAFFIAWCSPVVACFLRLPYVKRRLDAAVLQVQCLSFSYYFLNLFRFAGMPLPPLTVCLRLEIWKEVVFSFVAFLIRFPAVLISCLRIALQTSHIL